MHCTCEKPHCICHCHWKKMLKERAGGESLPRGQALNEWGSPTTPLAEVWKVCSSAAESFSNQSRDSQLTHNTDPTKLISISFPKACSKILWPFIKRKKKGKKLRKNLLEERLQVSQVSEWEILKESICVSKPNIWFR